MIRAVRIQISKEQFRTLPKDGRALLMLMGHALNQIAVLIKLVTFSSNKDPLRSPLRLLHDVRSAFGDARYVACRRQGIYIRL
jgi:hypothetical protein